MRESIPPYPPVPKGHPGRNPCLPPGAPSGTPAPTGTGDKAGNHHHLAPDDRRPGVVVAVWGHRSQGMSNRRSRELNPQSPAQKQETAVLLALRHQQGPQRKVQNGCAEVQIARPGSHPQTHPNVGVVVYPERDSREQSRARHAYHAHQSARLEIGTGAEDQADHHHEGEELQEHLSAVVDPGAPRPYSLGPMERNRPKRG